MNNEEIVNKIHNYMMQPGDGTLYRFSIQRDCGDYVFSPDADPRNVWLAINMPGGCGVGLVPKRMLRVHKVGDGLDGYMRSNGMGAVDHYTLRAVLLAATVLAFDPHNIDRAAQKMLEAGNVPTSEGE